MEQIQPEKIQVVVKSVPSNGIILQNTKGKSLNEEEIKTTEYFLEVEEQDSDGDIHQAQYVTIENQCEDSQDVDSQFVPLEIDDNGQIILEDKDVILWDELCRICANTSDKVVPIFFGEGLKHNLCKKIENYLPFSVSEEDTLPLQVCYNCAATLLAWHEMTQNCLSAQQRLIELQNKLNLKNQVQNSVSVGEDEEIIDNGTEMETTSNQDDQVEDEKKIELEDVPIINESETDRTEQHQQHQRRQRQQKESSTSYICRTCDRLYEQEVDLIKHMRLDHETKATATRYECDTCGRSYLSKLKLLKHVLLHERRTLCKSMLQAEEQVIESSKVFDRQTHKLKFICQLEDCNAVLKSRRGFLRHMRVHEDRRPIICEHCGKCYRIEDDLKRHIDDVHRKIKRYECDICNRFFAAKGTRDAHRRIHTREKPFPCPECDKHFRSVNLLGIHRRIHKDLRPFKCSYCPMAFREKQKCQHHEAAIHTKNKPHKCDQCNRQFAAKGELNRHRSVHFPEHRPYMCSECKIGFRLSRYLRTHIKRYHAKEAETMLNNLQRLCHVKVTFKDESKQALVT
ncbi:zinc finger protein draculin-like isoform X2 [Phymastichus coffea]|nr:zinc finger protein draculin-like isoform X2 [Phymastichus coffea]